jgi:NAD(P)-dependent dehydrogenase (short-subunit alcohol dehydrogenase family)
VAVDSIDIPPNVPLEPQRLAGGEGWRQGFEVNVNDFFISTRPSAVRMKARGQGGVILLMTSTSGINSPSRPPPLRWLSACVTCDVDRIWSAHVEQDEYRGPHQ